MPRDTGWFHTLGSATLTAFLVQAITGVVLAFYYKPDPDKAYESVQFITNDLTLGWLVRGMHRWGASVFIILMFLHMARVFLFGPYKYPRELNWIIGVLLLALGMLEGFTGYLLPWDQTAYWATVVGINLNGTAPVIGPFLAQFLAGGAEIGSDTLSKFYSLHMLVIPGAIFALIGLHLYLVIRLGVTSPPWSDEAAGRDGPTRWPTGGRQGLVRPGARGESLPMASRRIEERRAQHKRYKEDVERDGKPFFPYAMFHDTVMSLVVVCVIVGLACVWYFTAGDCTEPGWLGPYYTDEADPGTTNFVPRPDWYFYFLFYLLRIFKWPDTVVLGTVGIPNILLGILIALPFIDLRRERRLSRRPVAIVAVIIVVLAMGTLTYKGATAKESLGSETIQEVPKWARDAGLRRQRGGCCGRGALRRRGLPAVPHLPRQRLDQPRRARPVRHRLDRPDRRLLPALHHEPGRVRKHGYAAVRHSRPGEPSQDRGLPRSLQGPEGLSVECLPRRYGRVRRSVRREAAARPDGVGLRGGSRGLGRGHRGARDGALRRREPPAG